jgi:hypothetical protein
VRELPVTGTSLAAGLQSVCWDMRVEPIRGAAPAGPGGGFGGGGAGAQRARPIEGMPTPLPSAGYMPDNPCRGGGGGGGGGGFGGGGANLGPYVTPGDYTVALVADGSVVDRKPLRIVMDPKVDLQGEARVAYDAFLADLHARQQRGTDMAATLSTLANEIATVKSKLGETANLPADVRSRFTALEQAFDSVRVKFGVAPGRVAGSPAPAAPAPGGPGGGGGGGGGGFGGGAAATANALARVGQVKGLIGGIWETPSEGSRRQASEATTALDAAMNEANAVLTTVRSLAPALAPFNLVLTPR